MWKTNVGRLIYIGYFGNAIIKQNYIPWAFWAFPCPDQINSQINHEEKEKTLSSLWHFLVASWGEAVQSLWGKWVTRGCYGFFRSSFVRDWRLPLQESCLAVNRNILGVLVFVSFHTRCCLSFLLHVCVPTSKVGVLVSLSKNKNKSDIWPKMCAWFLALGVGGVVNTVPYLEVLEFQTPARLLGPGFWVGKSPRIPSIFTQTFQGNIYEDTTVLCFGQNNFHSDFSSLLWPSGSVQMHNWNKVSFFGIVWFSVNRTLSTRVWENAGRLS